MYTLHTIQEGIINIIKIGKREQTKNTRKRQRTEQHPHPASAPYGDGQITNQITSTNHKSFAKMI